MNINTLTVEFLLKSIVPCKHRMLPAHTALPRELAARAGQYVTQLTVPLATSGSYFQFAPANGCNYIKILQLLPR